MATVNYQATREPEVLAAAATAAGKGWLVALLLGVTASCGLGAGSDPLPRLERQLELARTRHAASTNEATAAWQLGRATFEYVEFAPEKRKREELAVEGVAACRAAVALDPNSAGAHYYLAMNLGQLARFRPLSALGMVREIERGFLKAGELQPGFDRAGPERNVGLLYRDAPGWPVSLGSNPKAREHLSRAVELAPNHPENRLLLAESAVKWKDAPLVDEQVQALRVLLPKARAGDYAGPEWDPVWVKWDARWKDLQESHEKLQKRANR